MRRNSRARAPCSLRTYAAIDRCKEAEAIFRSHFVDPFLAKCVTQERLEAGTRGSCKGLDGIYAEIVTFVKDGCSIVLQLAQRSLRGQGFDFLSNSIFPAITHAIQVPNQPHHASEWHQSGIKGSINSHEASALASRADQYHHHLCTRHSTHVPFQLPKHLAFHCIDRGAVCFQERASSTTSTPGLFRVPAPVESASVLWSQVRLELRASCAACLCVHVSLQYVTALMMIALQVPRDCQEARELAVNQAHAGTTRRAFDIVHATTDSSLVGVSIPLLRGRDLPAASGSVVLQAVAAVALALYQLDSRGSYASATHQWHPRCRFSRPSDKLVVQLCCLIVVIFHYCHLHNKHRGFSCIRDTNQDRLTRAIERRIMGRLARSRPIRAARVRP